VPLFFLILAQEKDKSNTSEGGENQKSKWEEEAEQENGKKRRSK
jgi:hypothetical protein